MGCFELGVLGRWFLLVGDLSDEGRLFIFERKYWFFKVVIFGVRVGIGIFRKDFYKTIFLDVFF